MTYTSNYNNCGVSVISFFEFEKQLDSTLTRHGIAIKLRAKRRQTVMNDAKKIKQGVDMNGCVNVFICKRETCHCM